MAAMPPSRPGTVLVTGGALRIGRAIALDFARQGWAVAVHYHHSEAEAQDLVAEIERMGARAAAFRAELAREEETQGLVARAVEALGPLTCLVNNASPFDNDTVETTTRESWDLHLEVNLRAPFVLTQHFARQLPDDAEGNIVNMLDQRVWRLTPNFVSYTVSKTGLWTLTQTMAQALAPRIRVNAIGPGPTMKSRRQSDAHFERQRRSTILRRGADAEEICTAIRFLLGARSVTGQMIALDGGQHLAWRTPDTEGISE
jgi:NAD(P)-dependent dehydrogenase (short-subunit alcohol dehydrogenase family)